MNILKIQSSYSNSIPFTKFNGKNKLDFSSSVGSSTSIESEKSSSLDIWSELSQKHNIRSATYEEIDDLSLKLYESGEISLMQRALLTDDLSKIPQPFIQNSLKNNGYFTQSNSNGERDWIKEFEIKAAQQLKSGNMNGYTSFQNIVTKILKRLEQ